MDLQGSNDTGQLFAELKRQRYVLGCVLLVNLALLGVFALSAAVVIHNMRAAYEGNFSDRAQEVFLQGDLEQLEKMAEDRVASHPNDPWVYWFLAQVALHREQENTARAHFEHVLSLDPTWAESIDPYLEQLGTTAP